MKSLTPNIKVDSIETSLRFYRDLLGFKIDMQNPETNPVWAKLSNGSAEIMLHQKESIDEEYPSLKGINGGALTFFISIDDAPSLYEKVKSSAEVIMPLTKKFYGTTEFAIKDPDGFILTFSS
jgi:uncharacterized glyoxalase superfamily protein PhnB